MVCEYSYWESTDAMEKAETRLKKKAIASYEVGEELNRDRETKSKGLELESRENWEVPNM